MSGLRDLNGCEDMSTPASAVVVTGREAVEQYLAAIAARAAFTQRPDVLAIAVEVEALARVILADMDERRNELPIVLTRKEYPDHLKRSVVVHGDEITVLMTRVKSCGDLRIGSGRKKKVKLAVCNGQWRAAGIIRKGGFSDEFLAALRREVNLCREFPNLPCVLQTYAVGETPDKAYFIQQLCEEGDWFDLVITTGRIKQIPFQDRLLLFRDLLGGAKALYDREIIHRDLKIENILLTRRGRLRGVVGDLGAACKAEDVLSRSKLEGTPTSLSPELFILWLLWKFTFQRADLPSDEVQDGIEILGRLTGIAIPEDQPMTHELIEQLNAHLTTSAVDAWSLGIILYESLVLNDPFFIDIAATDEREDVEASEKKTLSNFLRYCKDPNGQQVLEANLRRDLENITPEERPIAELALRLLVLDPARRLSVGDAFAEITAICERSGLTREQLDA